VLLTCAKPSPLQETVSELCDVRLEAEREDTSVPLLYAVLCVTVEHISIHADVINLHVRSDQIKSNTYLYTGWAKKQTVFES